MKLVFALLATTACYQAGTDDGDHCKLACEDGVCPGGLTCNDEKRCSIGGEACLVVPDGGSTRKCAGSIGGLIGEVCFDPVPPAVLTSTSINTDTNMPPCELPITGDVGACVVIVDSEISFPVRAEGSRPLVLWSADTLVIGPMGAIDVSSRNNSNDVNTLGAGANAAGCRVVNGTDTANGGTGGAGGSFGSNGGNGGEVATMAGGMAQSSPEPLALHGGCPGGNGGRSNNNGGDSGGAVYLMAGEIELRALASIDASGAGGNAPPQGTGGGGGGSGGLIGFDAKSVTIQTSAKVVALGGGGSAGGAGGGPGGEGDDPGTDGLRADRTLGPCGAVMTNHGGAGANGLSAGLREEAESGGDSGGNGCGGGGGGGGDGVVRVFADATDIAQGAIVRPNPK